VQAAPPTPQPKILKFSITPKPLTKGGTAIVTYEFNENVKKALLEPIGLELDVNGNSKTFATPDVAAPTKLVFTLVAEGEGGAKAVKKAISVQVIEASLANIVKFEAYPTDLAAPGEVTLSWQLSNAVRAEIGNGSGAPQEVDANKGTQVFQISKTTVFTLIGIDQKGIPVSKKCTVKVTPPPQPEVGKGTVEPGGVPPR